MRKTYANILCLLVALGSVSAYAQWVPVTSNIRFTNEVMKDGKTTRTVREGVFYRTENGSTLTHWTRGDLDIKRGNGEFFDNQRLSTFEIFYEAKKMIEKPLGLSEPRKPDYDMDLKPVGAGSVEDIPCDLVSVKFGGPNMKLQEVGSACVARNLGLLLKQETNYPKPDGTAIHTLLEMYNIKLNAAPDKNEFDLLHTFTVMKKDASSAPTVVPE